MKKKNVVTIGGGTGSFVLLSGLKKYPVNISAIVSMADDGGSTGLLRDELGVLPPGDVRQCLVALSDSSDTLRELMNYRFGGKNLKGHSFGNLFLSALEKICKNFSKGVEEAGKILNVKGEVIPVTEDDISLRMELEDGKMLRGEHEINMNFSIEKIGIKKFYLKPKAASNPKAIEKIMEADVIIIGPGNHYCSVLPNMLVPGISSAIRRSKAKVIYICNLVNKKGHTEKFGLDDYVDSVNEMIGKKRIDYVTYNIKKPSDKLIAKYRRQREELTGFFPGDRKNRNYKVIRADLLSSKVPVYSKNDAIADIRSFIRHDSRKLSKVIMMISEIGDYENLIKDIV
ncbi:MAG: gluconeogenesis factor YvcK family protein [Parcubacteria group bacterium]|jgi:uncharacterized cofD-like protein